MRGDPVTPRGLASYFAASPGTFRLPATSSSETKGHVSEVDLMGAIYPLSFHRRIERQWAERIKSLGEIHKLAVASAQQALQRVSPDGSPIPVQAGVADPQQLDRTQPQ